MSTQSKSGGSQIVAEDTRCSLCGGSTVQDSGEIICTSCGAVLGQATHENSDVPHVKPSVWSYTSFKEGESQLLSKDRTELRIALIIEKMGDELRLPISVKGEAVLFSRRILKVSRAIKAEGACERLMVEDIATSSVILACRAAKIPRSIKDVVNAGERMGFEAKRHDVFRRVLKSVLSSGVRYSHNNPEEYVGYLVSRLIGNQQVERSVSQYVNPNEYGRLLHRYAVKTLSMVVMMMEGRSPWLMAASAICLADQALSGGKGLIGREEVSRIAECGLSNIHETLSLINKTVMLALEPTEIELKLKIAAKKDRLRKVM